MSRSNYSYDLEPWELIRYRGAVASATRGKRGQQLLRELLDALDAMPDKRLIAGALADESGGVCALGCVWQRRGMPRLAETDPSDYEHIAKDFGVAEALVREIECENDENAPSDPGARWVYMRQWVDQQITVEPANEGRTPGMSDPTALDRLLDECGRVGDCVECRLPPATKAEWERHDREYPKECPVQTGTGECWCLARCWCGHPETEGATDRERRLAAIVRVLLEAIQNERAPGVIYGPALDDALAEAERLAKGQEGTA